MKKFLEILVEATLVTIIVGGLSLLSITLIGGLIASSVENVVVRYGIAAFVTFLIATSFYVYWTDK